MTQQNSVHDTPLDVVVNFLTNILPFKNLSIADQRRLASKCIIDFFPKGSMIFRQGVTEVNHLYLIQKGGVKSYINDENGNESLKDYRGEGEYFGALPIIQKTVANLNVETIEDTFCFLINKEVFLTMLEKNQEISQYFLQTMSAKMVKNVYAEFRNHKIAPRTEGSLYLFSVKVGEIAKGRLFTARPDVTTQQAAKIMSDNHIGSLLLEDDNKKIIGIVTDKDIRRKVVARGMDYNTKISEIMVHPVHTISHNAICFDALLKMMKERVHHLAIEHRGEIIRMITTHDIMVAQGTSPLYLFREIMAEQKEEGLYVLAEKVQRVVRSLIEEGAKANNITRMITILNDNILERLLLLLLDELGEPPLPFCWLLMGSEGRREQTFKTDQDNALIYADSDDQELNRRAAEYFTVFAERVIQHLVKCGYPLCPGDMMASNPKWRQPLSVWKGYFRKWCNTPTPESVLNSTIFFDFRAGFGSTSLANEWRGQLTDPNKRIDLFLMNLARNCLSSRPPLSFFKNFIVEKDGEHKNTFDLKKRGLVFIVDFARLMSLKYDVAETNTMARLEILQENRNVPSGLCAEIIEAYEFLMHLRLVHQVQKLEGGFEPDNHINPKDLSDLERQTLKEAFSVITRLQDFIKLEFHVPDL
jgi:CBS domain-containing protein